MTYILAIDPGTTQSAWALIDPVTRQPNIVGKEDNDGVLKVLRSLAHCSTVAIEMVASYGMPVGAEVFETVHWAGRFDQRARDRRYEARIVTGGDPQLVYRRDIKLHHCGSPRANDANVTQALVDRFAHGQPNRGKGTKNQPGWFHGFAADIWQAYALAVYVADTANKKAEVA